MNSAWIITSKISDNALNGDKNNRIGIVERESTIQIDKDKKAEPGMTMSQTTQRERGS